MYYAHIRHSISTFNQPNLVIHVTMEAIRAFARHVDEVISVMQTIEYAMYDDAVDSLEAMENSMDDDSLLREIAVSNAQVKHLCDLYDTFAKELYKAKGCIECVSNELYALQTQATICVSTV